MGYSRVNIILGTGTSNMAEGRSALEGGAEAPPSKASLSYFCLTSVVSEVGTDLQVVTTVVGDAELLETTLAFAVFG